MTTLDRLAQLDQAERQIDQQIEAQRLAERDEIARETAKKNAAETLQEQKRLIQIDKLLAAREEGVTEINKAKNGELYQLKYAALEASHAGQIEVAERHANAYRQLAARVNVQYVDRANGYLNGVIDLAAQAAINSARSQGKSDWDISVAAERVRNQYKPLELHYVQTIEEWYTEWVQTAPVNSRDRRIRIGLTFATLGSTTGDPGFNRQLGLA